MMSTGGHPPFGFGYAKQGAPPTRLLRQRSVECSQRLLLVRGQMTPCVDGH